MAERIKNESNDLSSIFNSICSKDFINTVTLNDPDEGANWFLMSVGYVRSWISYSDKLHCVYSSKFVNGTNIGKIIERWKELEKMGKPIKLTDMSGKLNFELMMK